MVPSRANEIVSSAGTSSFSRSSVLMTWTFYNVWPKKWEIDALNSTENNYVVESMTLSYANMVGT